MNKNTSSRWPDAPRVRAECPDDGGRYLLNAVEQVWTCEKPHQDGWHTIRTSDLELEADEFPEAGYDGDGACILWIVTPEPIEVEGTPEHEAAYGEDEDSSTTDAILNLLKPDPWGHVAAPSPIHLHVVIENVYDDGTVREEGGLQVPRPRDLSDLDSWAYDYLFPLTGTGRTSGEAGYFVKITESPDVPVLVGRTFEWGI